MKFRQEKSGDEKVFLSPASEKIPRTKVPDVDDCIEWVDKNYGLDTPVIVIGYGILNRCVSVRSRYRVITHAIVNAQDGASMGNMHQMCMRAAGMTREQRKRNGFGEVKLLCREHDYQLLQTLYHFTTAILKEAGNGAQESLNTWKFVDYNTEFDVILESWRSVAPKGIAKHWPLNNRPKSVSVASYIFEGTLEPQELPAVVRDGAPQMPFGRPSAEILHSFGLRADVASGTIEATGFKVYPKDHPIFTAVSNLAKSGWSSDKWMIYLCFSARPPMQLPMLAMLDDDSNAGRNPNWDRDIAKWASENDEVFARALDLHNEDASLTKVRIQPARASSTKLAVQNALQSLRRRYP